MNDNTFICTIVVAILIAIVVLVLGLTNLYNRHMETMAKAGLVEVQDIGQSTHWTKPITNQ